MAVQEHPGVSAKRCLGTLLYMHAGKRLSEDAVESLAEMLDNEADELMREVSATGLIRSKKQDDGTVRWFVA